MTNNNSSQPDVCLKESANTHVPEVPTRTLEQQAEHLYSRLLDLPERHANYVERSTTAANHPELKNRASSLAAAISAVRDWLASGTFQGDPHAEFRARYEAIEAQAVDLVQDWLAASVDNGGELSSPGLARPEDVCVRTRWSVHAYYLGYRTTKDFDPPQMNQRFDRLQILDCAVRHAKAYVGTSVLDGHLGEQAKTVSAGFKVICQAVGLLFEHKQLATLKLVVLLDEHAQLLVVRLVETWSQYRDAVRQAVASSQCVAIEEGDRERNLERANTALHGLARLSVVPGWYTVIPHLYDEWTYGSTPE